MKITIPLIHKTVFLRREGCIVFGIFLVALFIRLYHLGTLPKGFYVEEMTNAYVGRFILLHGKDLYGNFLPLLYFDKFGDYPPILPIYLAGISTFLFGVTEFAARFPFALVGALTVFPLYLLSKYLTKDQWVSYIVGILLAFLPWHVVLSRTSAEGVLGMFALTCGLLYLVRGITQENNRHIWIAGGLFFLTYFLYPGLRILSPMCLFPIPWYVYKKHRPIFTTSLIITVLLIVATIGIASTKWGRARFDQTSIFKSPEVREQITTRSQVLSNGLGRDNVLRARIFHNKIVLYARELVHQYFLYFSPQYLFYESGGQFRYFNVPDQGLVFIAVFPLLFFALMRRNKKISSVLMVYVVYLMLIAPITAAITVDFPPHAHRSMFMILPILLLAGVGFSELIEITKRQKLTTVLFLLVVLIETIYFWNQYAFHGDGQQSMLRNDGDPEMIKYIVAHHTEYDEVIAPVYERFPLYYAFFSDNFDASLIGKWRTELRIDQIGNVKFIEAECPTREYTTKKINEPVKRLVVDGGNCDPAGGRTPIITVHRTDSTLAYRAYKLGFMEQGK